MKIVALLSWFDEKPEHLERMVRSLPKAGITHLAALDGAYALLPDGTGRSHADQHDAIRTACTATGIKLKISAPKQPWVGNEVEKRTALFALAEKISTPTAWYFVLDADETITKVPADLHQRLAETKRLVGEVTYCESKRQIKFPKFFRAIRGLHCYQTHYTYCTPDGERLWGHSPQGPLARPLSLSDMYVKHHLQERTFQREAAKRAYYNQRDRLGIETVTRGR